MRSPCLPSVIHQPIEPLVQQLLLLHLSKAALTTSYKFIFFRKSSTISNCLYYDALFAFGSYLLNLCIYFSSS